MKSFLKILLIIFTIIITAGEITSFVVINLSQEVTSYLPFQEPQLTIEVLENHSYKSCLNGEYIVTCNERVRKGKGKAAKGGTKMLNQFNSAESLIQGAGKLSRVKGARQGFVKGNVDDIFKSITQGGKQLAPNRVQLPNGTIITKYFSSTTGVPTLQINKGNQIFKIRIE